MDIGGVVAAVGEGDFNPGESVLGGPLLSVSIIVIVDGTKNQTRWDHGKVGDR